MRAILTYHSIDPSGSPISVGEDAFRRQVGWLLDSGVPVVSLETLIGLPEGTAAVSLTFDDAFASFATRAWPLLREHGLPVTLFVPTGHAGGSNAWDAGHGSVPVLPLLSWSELGALQAEGVTLGSHTRSHADLRRVSDACLEDELAGSAERMAAETGRSPTAFAYPFGALDARVVDAVRREYGLACTTQYRVLGAREDPHRLPRLDAFYLRGTRPLDPWGSARLRRRVWARAGARAARHGLTWIGVLK